MGVTWKDAATTALAAGAGALAYIKYQGVQTWVTGPRLGILVLGLIGIVMCTMGSDDLSHPSTWTFLLSGLGILALVFIVVGLITGAKLMFFALTAAVLALWLLTTVRHLAG